MVQIKSLHLRIPQTMEGWLLWEFLKNLQIRSGGSVASVQADKSSESSDVLETYS